MEEEKKEVGVEGEQRHVLYVPGMYRVERVYYYGEDMGEDLF